MTSSFCFCDIIYHWVFDISPPSHDNINSTGFWSYFISKLSSLSSIIITLVRLVYMVLTLRLLHQGLFYSAWNPIKVIENFHRSTTWHHHDVMTSLPSPNNQIIPLNAMTTYVGNHHHQDIIWVPYKKYWPSNFEYYSSLWGWLITC